jgi:hypothetical protein
MARSAKKGPGRPAKKVKDYQNGSAANDYDVDVDGSGEGHNSKAFAPDGPELRDFMDLVADEELAIANIMDAARKKCEGPRGAIKAAKKVLVESGYEAQVLTTLMRKERMKRKLEHVADKLNEDQIIPYRAMERALGDFADTALGQAALATASH